MTAYSIAICGDRQFANSLADMCAGVMPKVLPFTVKTFHSEDELLRSLCSGARIDLLLLDEALCRNVGADIAERLRGSGEMTCVVFLADEPRPPEKNSLQTVYYLSKSVSPAELEDVIKADLRRRTQVKCILIKCERKMVPVQIDGIIYLEVSGHSITVHTRTQDYVARMTFAQILGVLPSSRFVRCHNSYAVNLDRVARFTRTQGVYLDCGVTLPIGRKYFDSFRQCLSEYTEYTDSN